MTTLQWVSLLSGPIISIIAIFISNWLGRKTNENEFELQTMDKAYHSFYIPLMKLLISANKNSLTYYYLVAIWYSAPKEFKRKDDQFLNLIRRNIEYLPPKIVNLIPDYMVATGGAELFFGVNGYRENYRAQLEKASDLFDEIIKLSLEEANLISNRLGYPNISKPILEAFLNLEHSPHNYPRALPEIYQKSSPRQFVGPEPPYY